MAQTETEKKQSNRLFIVLLMISGFFVVELTGAKMAKSDVLAADAFHLLMDVLALGISLGAMRLAARKPTRRFTFGLRRAEPMAALANGILVLGAAVEIVRDALEHMTGTQATPHSGLMLGVASAALVVNGINAWLLHGAMAEGGHGHHHHGHGHGHAHHHHAHDHDAAADDDAEAGEDRGHQLNLRGAWLHLLGDALGSLAAFIAGLAIRLGASNLVDPLASFVVVAILVIGALRLIRDAALVLLEAAPGHLPVARIEKALLAVDGITHVTALHVWSLGTGHDAVTAHIRVGPNKPNPCAKACDSLRTKFSVEFVTIQIETDDHTHAHHAHAHTHDHDHDHADDHADADAHAHDHDGHDPKSHEPHDH